MADFQRLREQEEQEGFRENIGAERFFRSGRAGDWRPHPTVAQVRDVVDAHHRVMSAMGCSVRTPASQWRPIPKPMNARRIRRDLVGASHRRAG